jgi:hypothetical protein
MECAAPASWIFMALIPNVLPKLFFYLAIARDRDREDSFRE